MSTYAERHDGDFIEAAAIPEGRKVTLTIKSHAEPGTVRFKDGRDCDSIVLYFEETPKGLKLNKTNDRLVTYLLGDKSADWPGKKITIYRGLVKHPGAETLPVIIEKVRGRPVKKTWGVKIHIPDLEA